jgi:spermidine/putrescine transport system permease protein
MRNPLSAPKWTRAVIAAVLAALYIPFLWMLVRAFGGPTEWGLQWFEAVLQNSDWMQALGRSALVALAASAGATLLGLGAAVASKSRLGPWLEIFSVVALVLPELVFALSLLSWFVVLKLELSLMTVVLSHVTFSLSFSYFLILSRFRQIDPSLFEAARDLGASAWQTFRRVTFPLLMPSLGVSFLLCFLLSFDDFLISFFVSGAGSDTLPMKLYSSMKMGLSPQLHALATLMSLLSAAALYFVLSSSFVRSLSQVEKEKSPALPGPTSDRS